MRDRDRKPKFHRPEGADKRADKRPGPRRDAGRPPWRGREGAADDPVILSGWARATAALANPGRRIRKLLLTENAARRLAEEKIDTRVEPEIVRPSLIDQRLGPDAVHQGLLAEADPPDSPDNQTLAR